MTTPISNNNVLLANGGDASSVMDDLCRVNLAQMAGNTNYAPNKMNCDIHVGYGPIARGGTKSKTVIFQPFRRLQRTSLLAN
jgi:hypothetical protein